MLRWQIFKWNQWDNIGNDHKWTQPWFLEPVENFPNQCYFLSVYKRNVLSPKFSNYYTVLSVKATVFNIVYNPFRIYMHKNKLGAVVWLFKEWIHISSTLCTGRSQNKLCWFQATVTCVFFFHRERWIDEYGKKKGFTFMKNALCARYSTKCFRHLIQYASLNPVYRSGFNCRT